MLCIKSIFWYRNLICCTCDTEIAGGFDRAKIAYQVGGGLVTDSAHIASSFNLNSVCYSSQLGVKVSDGSRPLYGLLGFVELVFVSVYALI